MAAYPRRELTPAYVQSSALVVWRPRRPPA
jgi:hypothetical protein